eukprot:jgi/Ulvmu1/11369/UM075_0031.1
MLRPYEHAHKYFVMNLSRQLIKTPSSLDNFPPDTEANCRVAACEFISDLSNCLQLPKWVTCTAQMSLHQYYDVESVKTSDRMIISISALFVACKVHDRARSADTFVRAAWDVLCAAASKTDMEKNRELARLNDPDLVNQLVSSVLAGERAIFYALNFDLQPYKVHDLVMELSDGGLDKQFCASPQGRNLFKTAWETVAFGAYSHLTQQFSQLEIAWGHVVLAARLLGYSQHLFREDGQGHWVTQGLSFTNGELELLVNMISAPFILAAEHQPVFAVPSPGPTHPRSAFPQTAATAHSPPHSLSPASPTHGPPGTLRAHPTHPRSTRARPKPSPPTPAAMLASPPAPDGAAAAAHQAHPHGLMPTPIAQAAAAAAATTATAAAAAAAAVVATALPDSAQLRTADGAAGGAGLLQPPQAGGMNPAAAAAAVTAATIAGALQTGASVARGGHPTAIAAPDMASLPGMLAGAVHAGHGTAVGVDSEEHRAQFAGAGAQEPAPPGEPGWPSPDAPALDSFAPMDATAPSGHDDGGAGGALLQGGQIDAEPPSA